jgi:hypothetical protein
MSTVSISGDSITILETDTSKRPLRCICNFDVTVAITGLNAGMYRIFIFRINMFQDSMYFVDSTTCTISQQNSSSFFSRSQMSACHPLDITSVETLGGPKSFSLLGNRPNPFNPVTIIRYQIHRQSKVRLEIFDELGRFLATLVDEEKPLGDYEVPWNASNFSSGFYLCKLTVGNEIQTRKMTLLK